MSKLQFTLPFLRFKGFNEKIISCKLEKIVNNLEEFNFFSNLFWDAPSILKSKPILFNGQDFKKSPENSIIFIKDGSNAGTFTYCDKNSYIATTCDYFCVKINALYVYYFIKSKEKHIKNNLITGETIPHLYKKHLFSIIINFVNDKNEQIKISKFFSLLDKHIELWKRKLQLYLLKKKFIYDKIFKTSNEEIKLKNIFVEINEKTEYKNVMLASVGKNGIRLKSEVFHKINVKSDHKVKIAEKNYLIVGMGSKQIDSHINLLFDNIVVQFYNISYHLLQ